MEFKGWPILVLPGPYLSFVSSGIAIKVLLSAHDHPIIFKMQEWNYSNIWNTDK